MHRFRNIPAIHVGPKGSPAQLERFRWRGGVNSAWDEAVGAAGGRLRSDECALNAVTTVLGQVASYMPAKKPRGFVPPAEG